MWLSVSSGEVEEVGGTVVWGVVVGMLIAWPVCK